MKPEKTPYTDLSYGQIFVWKQCNNIRTRLFGVVCTDIILEIVTFSYEWFPIVLAIGLLYTRLLTDPFILMAYSHCTGPGIGLVQWMGLPETETSGPSPCPVLD